MNIWVLAPDIYVGVEIQLVPTEVMVETGLKE